ncbi:MAG: hypothetical protein ACJ8EH_12485 [Sphingomicrobium sp.]
MANLHLVGFAAASLLTGCTHVNQSGCVGSPRAEANVERTVRAFFVALRQEDKSAFQGLTTSSFYSFDAGKRYVGTELVDVVRSAHARGVQLNWSVGPVHTEVGCDVAWSSWENVGSAGIPPDVRPVRWLESAVLVRQNGNWKLDFFHSQRAAVQ